MTTDNQNWRWLNDIYEVPEAVRKGYAAEKEDGVFRLFKKFGNTPADLVDKDRAERYSEWLKNNP